MDGDVEILKSLLMTYPELLYAKDENGFQPLHEGVIRGQADSVQFLIEFSGAKNINERTHFGEGGTPLYWAQQALGNDHPVTTFLKSQGAVYEEPIR